MCNNYADKDYLSFTFMQRNQRVQCSKNLVQLLLCHYGKLKHWVMISLKRKKTFVVCWVQNSLQNLKLPVRNSHSHLLNYQFHEKIPKKGSTLKCFRKNGKIKICFGFFSSFTALAIIKNKDCFKCVMNQLVLLVVVWFLLLFLKHTFFANFRSSIRSSSPWESSKIACKNRHKYQKISLCNLCPTCWVDIIL